MLLERRTEREIIVKLRAQRPYGVKARILATHGGVAPAGILGPEGEYTLLLDDGRVLSMNRYSGPEAIRDTAVSDWVVKLEGFATAGEAEAAGLRMCTAILWSSVSNGRPNYMLNYTTPLPCVVYDRTGGGGQSVHVTAVAMPGRERSLEAFDNAFAELDNDTTLLLALELFAVASFARDGRARFVGLISSLEPLAEQQQYDQGVHRPEILQLVKTATEALRAASLPTTIKASLEGRISGLRRESVRQAYLRLARTYLDPDDVRTLDEAYRLRSDILHEGATHPDLGPATARVRDLVRKVLSGVTGLPLLNPPQH